MIMNTLFAYPIIISSSGGGADEKILWAILIVMNALWFVTLICALVHNSIENAKYDLKIRPWDREYFLIASVFCGAINGIAVFVGLIYWVATLL